VPDPDQGDWRGWEELFASREIAPGGNRYDALNIVAANGFGTVSSALIALPRAGSGKRPIWRFADGPPDRNSYAPVRI
jgi:hypothetical protein